MITQFRHWVLKSGIFCKHCSTLEEHQCYIRRPYKTLEGISRKECVLAVCSVCDGKQVFFANDFSKLNFKEDGEFSCKILGKSRIVVNDWVYIPGEPRPGNVKTLVRIKGYEILTIEYVDGEERRIKVPINKFSGPEAVRTYKLLPYQVGHTKIGDYIYHVNRRKVGIAVGMVHDKEKKLILKLDDGSILVLVVNKNENEIDNKKLSKNVNDALKDIESMNGFVVDTEKIKVKVSQRVAFISGVCDSLRVKEMLRCFVGTVDGVKDVVCSVKVLPRYVSDPYLEKVVHDALFKQHSGAFGVQIEVINQVAKVIGYVKDKDAYDAIFSSLINIPGLRDLRLELKQSYQQNFEELERSRRIVAGIAKANINNSKIIVTTIKGVTYLEGLVDSHSIKNKVTILAMVACKYYKNIENKLKVQEDYKSKSFVKIG